MMSNSFKSVLADVAQRRSAVSPWGSTGRTCTAGVPLAQISSTADQATGSRPRRARRDVPKPSIAMLKQRIATGCSMKQLQALRRKFARHYHPDGAVRNPLDAREQDIGDSRNNARLMAEANALIDEALARHRRGRSGSQ
ncbi:MAG: hypothetical protein ACR2PA_16930 [Hyphomicrobiaceae bacterium]